MDANRIQPLPTNKGFYKMNASKLYNVKSNARRAARKLFNNDDAAFEIYQEGDEFGFRAVLQGSKSEVTVPAAPLVADEVLDAAPEALKMDDEATLAARAGDEQANALLLAETEQVQVQPAPSLLDVVERSVETSVTERVTQAMSNMVARTVRHAVHDAVQEGIARGQNVFAAMLGTLNGDKVELNGDAPATGHKHHLADGCPLCGAGESSQTWATEGVSMLCHECSKTYSVATGKEIRSGYKKENVASGHKIQKDRPTQNGITRPSTGTQCDAVWSVCDELSAKGPVSAKDMRTLSEARKWNVNNTLIEFYQWRKFNGVTGRAK
jgi:hypothetical protein